MKGGDYVKDENDNHSRSMFAQLQQSQNFQNPTALHHHHPTFQNPRECRPSEEIDTHLSPSTAIRDPTTQTIHLLQPPLPPSSANDGASIETVRRPRGRPPGSKNKPKPPVIITREIEPSMSPYVLELPGGVDIVETILSYCRKRNMGLCILNGSGTVANVTLRQPSTTPGASVTFHGRFDILSLSATILTGNLGALGGDGGITNGFTISLAGPQGQVVGGAVVGSLFSAGTVCLVAASFNTPIFTRLPLEEESQNTGSPEGGHQQSQVSGGGDSVRSSAVAAAVEGAVESSCGGGGGGGGGGGVSMYNLGNDVIWGASGARQLPPPQHPPSY